MADTTKDLDRLLDHIRSTLNSRVDPTPGGWPKDIELALIDTVFASQAKYGKPETPTSQATGVHRVLKSYRDLRASSGDLDDLRALVATLDRSGLNALHKVNKQRVPGSSPNRLTKWQAVRDTAKQLVRRGAISSKDIAKMRSSTESTEALKRAFTKTSGVGDVTFNYFLLLLGEPRVKADTMVRAFVDEALRPSTRRGAGKPARVDASTAADLVLDAANALDVNAAELDYTIWKFQRDARSTSRR